jgi:hypothetical protein
MKLVKALYPPKFLNCDPIFSRKCKIHLWEKTRRSLSRHTLGMEIDKYYLRMGHFIHQLIYTRKPYYLYGKLLLGWSTRLSVLGIPQHNFQAALLWNNLHPSFGRGVNNAEKIKRMCQLHL